MTEEIEAALRPLWDSKSAPPFPAQLPLPAREAESYLEAVRTRVKGRVWVMARLFETAPLLAAWATLQGLARHYVGADRYVYPPISRTLGIDLSPGEGRERFKSGYLKAVRHLGIHPRHPSDPTSLFFAAVGVPDAALEELARIFLLRARRLGLPADEDLAARRAWQRAAVAFEFDARPRIRTPLAEDRTAYYAELFTLWRSGRTAPNASAVLFFDALDRMSRLTGTRKSDLTPPPILFWGQKGLSVLNDNPGSLQTVRFGQTELRLPSGQPMAIPEPWPDSLTWTAGQQTRDIPLSPRPGELLVFDLGTGRLAYRGPCPEGPVEVPPGDLILLSADAFDVTGQGADITVPFFGCHLSYARLADSALCIAFGNGAGATLAPSGEMGLTIDAPVIGRAGARPLYASSGRLGIVSIPTGAPQDRILRIARDGLVHYRVVALDAEGRGTLGLAEAGFAESAAPGPVRFCLLAPGVAPAPDARAETSSRVLLWPGSGAYDPEKPFEMDHVPGNFRPERSRGVEVTKTRLWVSAMADSAETILCFDMDGSSEDVRLPHRTTRVFHYALADRHHHFLPAGSTFRLDEDVRNDTIVIRSGLRDADLLACGQRIRRPFLARDSWPLPVGVLEELFRQDDRVLLERPDGSRHILLRLEEAGRRGTIEMQATADRIAFRIETAGEIDAIGLEIEDETGARERYAHALSSAPVDHPMPAFIEIRESPEAGVAILGIGTAALAGRSGLVKLTPLFREAGDRDMSVFTDRSGRHVAGFLDRETGSATPDRLARVGRWAATPWPDRIEDDLRRVLLPRLDALVTACRRGALLRPLLPALAALPLDLSGEGDLVPHVPRTEIFRISPDILERNPADLAGLGGGLAPVARFAAARTDRYTGDLSDWLAFILEEDPGPEADRAGAPGLDAPGLRDAFNAYRLRLDSTDLPELLGRGATARAIGDVLDTYNEEAGLLSHFDNGARGDGRGLLVALHLHRLARAARRAATRAFHARIARRTGLDRETAERVSSHLVHAAPELCGYFIALEASIAQPPYGEDCPTGTDIRQIDSTP
ncbi:hypothetical protein [Rhodovulum steppense]|uniref:Uncharacterized protein n=1 Tax=Rhodovulum steppense TaxID=540251 RepID=A0A4R1YGE8_9RHOB|nr:hypothetical protein [Rhodovulum steppense]TCM75229.1 hypothetical protein EV216_1422 [Rhodovulum steppense]